MFSLLGKYENPVNATIALLHSLGVKVTNTTINERLINHPDYPSLLSVSDALNRWQVENMAVKVEKEKIEELPLPFLAHSTENGGTFTTVTKITADVVEYAKPFAGGGGHLLSINLNF